MPVIYDARRSLSSSAVHTKAPDMFSSFVSFVYRFLEERRPVQVLCTYVNAIAAFHDRAIFFFFPSAYFRWMRVASFFFFSLFGFLCFFFSIFQILFLLAIVQ